MKVLAAWAIWLSWMAITVALGGRLPQMLFGILLISVPVFCCVLIFLGQQKLPLWANVALLLVQGAAGLYATMFVALIYAASTANHI